MMEFLSENGILGFLLYFGLIILIILRILKIIRVSEDQNKFIALSLGSLLLAILFPLKPSGSFFTTFNASMFFIYLDFLYFIPEK